MRRHKYRAQATECSHGHKHPSKREATRCAELHLLQRSGAISDLEYEPQYWFVVNGQQLKHQNGRRAGFKPDFGYIEAGQKVAEDIKSDATMTEAFALRATLFRACFPEIELRVVK